MRPLTKQQWAEVKYAETRLGGGVTPAGIAYPGGFDQTTPSLALQPGALRDVLNFECSQSGGYGRIAGYERVDGRASPSAATYQIVQLVSFTNVPAVGLVATQAVSGATGKIIAVNNAAGAFYIAVTQVTGTFDATHAITVPGPIAVGTATTTATIVSSQTNAQYVAAAADVYRALIGAVPGSGKILGVVAMIFAGVDNLYAFRNNAGGTAAAIYKTSAAGWVSVPLFNTVGFSGCTVMPQDGDTITQGANSAIIKRVMWASGTTGAGTAAGTLVVTTPAPGNFAAAAAVSSSGGVFNLTGVQAAIVIQPNGKYEFVKCNFSGQLKTRRIYGSDGANKCFEFDGTTYAPITTGLSPDTPKHVTFHKNYLFIAQNSSIFYCGAGMPFKWTTTDGAGEIATGDEVTSMITLPGSQTSATLAVFMASNTAFLYGIDPASFNYVTFNPGTGAIAYSTQNLFDTCVLDNLGAITLKTTQNYGNFLPNTLTKNIFPFIQAERTKTVASSVSRDKSQYRVFFSDGYGLWLTLVNQQYLGAGVVLFPDAVSCVDEQDMATGGEVSYFGTGGSSGYVMQMDVGTSFDGANIDAHITLAWDPAKSPRIRKRYRAASIEIQGSSYAQVYFGYQLGYGTTTITQPTAIPYASGFAPAPAWDSFTWDNFTWDGQTLIPTEVDMVGSAENVQVTISSTTNYIAAYNVNSVIYHYSMRRGLRV